MVQASGRYKAGDSEATEKPCGGADRAELLCPGARLVSSRSTSKNANRLWNFARKWMLRVETTRGPAECKKKRPAGFASIASKILFKLDACRDRRHARW